MSTTLATINELRAQAKATTDKTEAQRLLRRAAELLLAYEAGYAE